MKVSCRFNSLPECPPYLQIIELISTIGPAYEQVRKDDDETMWLLLDYDSHKSDALTVTKTGTGDLADFASNLEPQRASFGYVRVKYVSVGLHDEPRECSK